MYSICSIICICTSDSIMAGDKCYKCVDNKWAKIMLIGRTTKQPLFAFLLWDIIKIIILFYLKLECHLLIVIKNNMLVFAFTHM